MPETSAKRLQLIKELIPTATRVAIIWNSSTPWHKSMLRLAEGAATSLALDLRPMAVDSADELAPTFAAIAANGTEAVLFGDSPFFEAHRAEIVGLAARYGVPTVHTYKEWPQSGALMSYGAGYTAMFRNAGEMIAKILGGARPSDMPVEQPTRFEFVINMNTARRLGISVPPSVLVRADEVIQ